MKSGPNIFVMYRDQDPEVKLPQAIHNFSICGDTILYYFTVKWFLYSFSLYQGQIQDFILGVAKKYHQKIDFALGKPQKNKSFFIGPATKAYIHSHSQGEIS